MNTLQMAEHNGVQGSHRPTDSNTTPQIQQSVSLATMPSEILSAIVGLLLPEAVRSAISTERYPYSWTREFRLQFNELRAREAPGNENEWSFLYVNRRFHAEGVRYFHDRRYIIDITEKSLCRTTKEAMDAAFEWITCSYSSADLTRGSPFASGAFPGLMLSQVKELMVGIHPTSLGNFWHSLKEALDSLCNEHLLRRGPIKSLTIDLKDMTYSELWSKLAWTTFDPFLLAPAGRVAFQDYEDVLRTFKQVIALSGQCEIHLPYWMERHHQKDRLLETYVGELGARVLFSPAPKRPRDEANERDRLDLVALPEEYMP